MSNRTAAASRAVRESWENERRRVLEGKGTRDWTEEQQKQIKEKGKAYDSEGKAFEGQHMKSVSLYPEYQGDARNIQLLSHEEHLAAHGGNWQNPTNGYYDPVVKTMSDFGDGPPQPCAEVPLTNPLYVNSFGATKIGSPESRSDAVDTLPDTADTTPRREERQWFQPLRRVAQRLWRTAATVSKDPRAWATALAVGATVYEAVSNRSRSGGGDSTDSPSAQSTMMTDPGDEADISYETRKSPDEHDVSGYTRGDGTTVRPYRRGGNKD